MRRTGNTGHRNADSSSSFRDGSSADSYERPHAIRNTRYRGNTGNQHRNSYGFAYADRVRS